jgi:hypothetical protein
MSVWNGHYECACYHPLFVFKQFGDLERCALRRIATAIAAPPDHIPPSEGTPLHYGLEDRNAARALAAACIIAKADCRLCVRSQ